MDSNFTTMTTPAKPEPTPWTANSLNKPAPVCAGNETPWVDARDMNAAVLFNNRVVLTNDCRILERHLRRIVEAANKHGCGGPVMDAIQAAKEELCRYS